MSSPFQAIVWGRVLPLDTFDQAEITAYWNQWGGKTNLEPLCPTPNSTTNPSATEVPGSFNPSASAAPSDVPSATPSGSSPIRADRERPPMRLVSYLGLDDAGTAVLVDGRLIPVMDGYLTGPDLEPESLDDLRSRAATLAGATGIALADVEPIAPIPVPGKVDLRRPQLPRARQRGRPPGPDPAAPLLEVQPTPSSPTARPSSGPRARTPSTSRSSSASSSGRPPTACRATDALDHVAGYVVVNDVSARDWQGIPAALAEGEVGDGQWLRAKGSDTFLPMGPVFVTADEIPDPQALRLRSWRIPGSGPDAGRAAPDAGRHDRRHDLDAWPS